MIMVTPDAIAAHLPSGSPLLWPTMPSTMPAGPNRMGQNNTAITAQTKPTMENTWVPDRGGVV